MNGTAATAAGVGFALGSMGCGGRWRFGGAGGSQALWLWPPLAAATLLLCWRLSIGQCRNSRVAKLLLTHGGCSCQWPAVAAYGWPRRRRRMKGFLGLGGGSRSDLQGRTVPRDGR